MGERVEGKESVASIHPRIIYDILNQIKIKGSIDAKGVVDTLDKFSHLNSEQSLAKVTQKDCLKFLGYGMDAVKQTRERYKNGLYLGKSSLNGSQSGNLPQTTFGRASKVLNSTMKVSGRNSLTSGFERRGSKQDRANSNSFYLKRTSTFTAQAQKTMNSSRVGQGKRATGSLRQN
mmetsp:Transcript_13377/g.22772  ORF Transcript_13377/g.22772 Transcript_13377/m.22772 type:complete len:176 (+) Transcript_13377:398-925(+)|eukprot:CAMPEP_0168615368 /NCGR_PEP_ID=MMETSP0449_2-20121227/4468_1 /TAXON_ID=1082188 /ORGANISM="Strombidium rassoulzadegani, Strain ras09" /LENGTH=175 /DNA_ID=CAMNT_0008656105 /DNA_START=305 /DNA_END=832 /DNA_ORIENTATION=+